MADFAAHVRWDRIGRMALLFVALLLVYLYINPALTWISTWQEAKAKRAEVAELQREHDALVKRERALRRAGSIETEARKIGMVKVDERAYVVRGLPGSP